MLFHFSIFAVCFFVLASNVIHLIKGKLSWRIIPYPCNDPEDFFTREFLFVTSKTSLLLRFYFQTH